MPTELQRIYKYYVKYSLKSGDRTNKFINQQGILEARMAKEIRLHVTFGNLRKYVASKVSELENKISSSEGTERTVACFLRDEYESLLKKFNEKPRLRRIELQEHINNEIDWLVDMQRCERQQRRLGDTTKETYGQARRAYYDALAAFGLERVRNQY